MVGAAGVQAAQAGRQPGNLAEPAQGQLELLRPGLGVANGGGDGYGRGLRFPEGQAGAAGGDQGAVKGPFDGGVAEEAALGMGVDDGMAEAVQQIMAEKAGGIAQGVGGPAGGFRSVTLQHGDRGAAVKAVALGTDGI